MFWKRSYRFSAEAGQWSGVLPEASLGGGKFAEDVRERKRFHRAGANGR